MLLRSWLDNDTIQQYNTQVYNKVAGTGNGPYFPFQLQDHFLVYWHACGRAGLVKIFIDGACDHPGVYFAQQ